MSSILDALKKVEEERAAQLRAQQPGNFHAASAGVELLGEEVRPRSPHRSAGVPMAAIAGVIVVLLIALVASLTLLFAGRATSPQVAANPAPIRPVEVSAPTPAASTTPEVITAADPAPNPVASPAPKEVREEPAIRPAAAAIPPPQLPEPTPQSAPETMPAPAAVEEIADAYQAPEVAAAVQTEAPAALPQTFEAAVAVEEEAPFEVAQAPVPEEAPVEDDAWENTVFSQSTPPEPLTTPSATAAARSALAALPEDIRQLPHMARGDRSKFGLDDLTFNLIREEGSDTIEPHAVINLIKVYLGERIPGSRAKLVGVRRHGVAVELESTGERYYLPRR